MYRGEELVCHGQIPIPAGHKPILYGWLKTSKHKWYAGRAKATIWWYDKPKKNVDHLTMDPMSLLCYPIKNFSAVNSIVLDTFGGSVSTLKVCQQMDRICWTMESGSKYASVIVRRYIELCGSNGGHPSCNQDGVAVVKSIRLLNSRLNMLFEI